MPGTVKSELLSDADRSHKCDSQEKICRIRHLPLDKSHFITEDLCAKALPAAVLESFPVLPSRNTLDAAEAARLEVCLLAKETPPFW